MNTPHHISHCQQSCKRGFALVISMMLMGFILLLCISITSLVQVETQSANNQTETQQARLNALLGINLALAQLQLYTGNDQRVTANAEILEEPNDNIKIAHPNWVGVWATADSSFTPQTLEHYSNSGSKDALGIETAAISWLVSGNNTLSTTFLPSQQISTDSVTLLGPGSASTAEDYVEAPIVEFTSSQNKINKYAFWISDEGVKGNIAFEQEPSDLITLAEYQNYPLKSGSAVLQSGDNTEAAPIFGDISLMSNRLVSLSQLDNLSTQNTVSKELAHDVTTRSQGVLANVRDGGLRKDLADYMQLPDGEMFTDPKGYVATPDWRQIKSYLNLSEDLTGNTNGALSITARPYYPNNHEEDKYQQGIHPVPVRLGIYVDAAFIEKGTDQYGINLYFLPVIALWNPYDVAIKPQKYYLSQWGGAGNQKLQFAVGKWDGGNNWEHKAMLLNDGVTEDATPRIYGIDSSPILYNQGANEILVMRFMIDDENGLEPGETKVYTAEGLSLYQNHQLKNVLKEGFRPGEGFYVELAPPSGSSYASPYLFETDASDPIQDLRIDLGVEQLSGTKNADFLNEWWYFSAEGTTTLMTIAGLNRAGLTYSIPTSDASYGSNTWNINEDGRPKAYYPTVRTASDNSAMPYGIIEGENAQNSLDDFPAYGFLYELKQAYNDQNFDTQLRRRRWLANFNPRAPKSQQYGPLGGSVGQINQNYIGQLRARSYDTNDNQSDLYYSPTIIGEDNQNTYFGYSSQSGSQRTILYNLPRKNIPVSGVGSLMNVNFASTFTHNTGLRNPANMVPAYVIGNSLADPHLPDGEIEIGHAFDKFSHFDYSYKINKLLWDDYFSSTDLFNGNGPHDPRFISYPNKDTIPSYNEDERPYTHAAAKLMQAGAFNINSTSEKAWQMLLASTFGSDVQKSDGSIQEHADMANFLRQSLAFGEAFKGNSEDEQSAYDGYRVLSSKEIIELSQEIVKQIKSRGPFTSVSDFVNRTIDIKAPDEHKRMGALQAAIDATQINKAFVEAITSDSSDNELDPLSNYPNTEALYGKVGANAPGYLSQADLLNKIGNRLSARSDTFVIRAYGETTDLNGTTSARAYCEAVVQRTPNYINESLDEATAFPPSDSVNKAQGRRYTIRSIRWIRPDDV
ncbi:hypothetical protein QEH59_00670 [Coraliomargarita sp. SDUM461004]|uniref:Uncharacterized protein n=1 Tax=Thalassobacterium sedimentorum TaxID=3041258 RepID=A0ABU1ADV3_9BACT|nr:hypothetical protein [Coraliomargarita sp. SDUM461004]MDQ8192917.1 hypothetical protein [Coraliomargarita sp. SDUM461004]